jgi:Domain of unknown function (DUF4372)
MRHHNTLLHGLLQFVPWGRFEALVEEHGSDRGVRKLSSKSQLVALIHAQLSGASSLREVEATMASQQTRLYHLGAAAPKRSTLADANAERSADVFCGLFEALLAQAHPELRRASREAIRLVDATSVGLTALGRHQQARLRCKGARRARPGRGAACALPRHIEARQ